VLHVIYFGDEATVYSVHYFGWGVLLICFYGFEVASYGVGVFA
jgi:hypothetical protein